MPFIFSKEEVQKFLAEQGIDIADDNIHSFIADLKKLIKHEDMQRRRRRLGHLPDETVLNSTDTESPSTSTGQSTYEDQPRTRRQPERPPTRRPVEDLEEDEVDNLSDSGSTVSYDSSSNSDSFETDAYVKHQIIPRTTKERNENTKVSRPPVSRAPPPEKKEPPVLKRVTAPPQRVATYEKVNSMKPPATSKEANRVVGKTNAAKEPITKTTEPRNNQGKNVGNGGDVDRRPAPQPKPSRRPFSGVVSRPKSANSNVPQTRPRTAPAKREPDELFYALDALLSEPGSSEENLRGGGDGDYQSETAYKKPKAPGPPPKVARDPVALYHWYKRYNWDVYSVPGEDRHMQLRWNVRAKTEGHRPCVNGQPLSYGKHKL